MYIHVETWFVSLLFLFDGFLDEQLREKTETSSMFFFFLIPMIYCLLVNSNFLFNFVESTLKLFLVNLITV